MKTFRVTDLATGEVATEYVSEAPLVDPSNPFTDPTLYSTTVVWDSEAPHEPILPPEPLWKITKLAFRNRFSQPEKVTIEIASLDNPAALMAQRQMAAALRAYQSDVATATFIDLKRADTRAGVQALESYGLLAAGRAAVILDTVPTAEELWHG